MSSDRPRERARSTTAKALAAVYAALAEVDPTFEAATPAVVFVGTSCSPECADRLRRFGFTVTQCDADVEKGAYLTGGSSHGTWLPAEGSVEEHSAAVAAVAERARLRDWAGDVAPEPSFTTMHKPGSDSRGVVQFAVAGSEVVAKVGAATVIADEVRFATGVNALLAADGRRGLFPVVHGVRTEGGQAVSLMEAGTPMPLAPLFLDDARTTFAPAALDILEPHLDQVGAWYRSTADARRPTVADYLYRERYHLLPRHADFVRTFTSLFPTTDLGDVLDARLLLPGGAELPSYTESVAWLDTAVPDLLPDGGSAVHGDIYAANMLLRPDGSPVLIDPRTVWEGRDRPDVGYGDPVFDFATLLHGVFPMAAVLRAVETGTTEALVDVSSPADGVLDLTSLTLPGTFPDAVGALVARMLRGLPHAEPAPRAETRLYIGAATSLAGWLKYERSLRTPQAWLATFAYITWYLAVARQLWEHAGSEGEKDL
ncbi:phosphotransferase family protein [Saccharothrix isguenensis]